MGDVPCGCCPDCTGKASGTMGCCEDDGCTDIAPPDYFAVLVVDPARPGALPYWERPANLPAPVLNALFVSLLTEMAADPVLAQQLFAIMAPYVGNLCKSQCGPVPPP